MRRPGERALEAQKLQLQRQLQRLRRYTQALEVIQELRRIPFDQIDTACIVPFELADAGVLRQYMDDPYLYSRVQDSSDLSRERRGLTVAGRLLGVCGGPVGAVAANMGEIEDVRLGMPIRSVPLCSVQCGDADRRRHQQVSYPRTGKWNRIRLLQDLHRNFINSFRR
ncbi:MAG: hypothetical protein V8R40_11425 [Dysosmobacter sp.]